MSALTVVGRGPLGSAIARTARQAGYRVQLSGRGDGVGDTELLVLAIPGRAVVDFLREHARALAGRVIVDATNNLAGPPTIAANLRPPFHQAEAFMQHVPDASHVRALCTLGWESIGAVGAVHPFQPYAGPAAAVPALDQLLAGLGLDPQWMGDGAQAFEVVDAAAQLWLTAAFATPRGRKMTLTALAIDDKQPPP